MRFFDSQRRKPLIGLLLAFAMVLSLLPAMTGTAGAAQILPEEVAIAQAQSGTCTLASAAMMIRGRMYLSGNSKWNTITESDIRGDVWLEGAGIYYSWTYTTVGVIITGDHEDVYGISESQLSAMLSRHPEGIEIHCASVPHAVLVTDYTDGVFYCFDPAQYYSGRRIPLEASWLGERLGSQSSILAAITSYWYISSYSIQPDTAIPTARPVTPTAAPTVAPTTDPNVPVVPARELTVMLQPTSQIGMVGEKVTFTAGAEGAEDLTYQWEYSRDGISWKRSSSTGTTATCLLNPTTEGTWYRCLITEPNGGCVYTNAVQALVRQAPVILRQPQDLNGPKNSKGTFTISAQGDGISYRWQYSDNEGKTWKNSKSTSDHAGVTLSTAHNGRLYRCVVTDVVGQQTVSQTARINVSDKLQITRQPQNAITVADKNVSFSVAAEGKSLTYQWQSSADGQKWQDEDSTGKTLDFTASADRNNRLYRCVIRNAAGNQIISSSARLLISSLKFTVTPESATVSNLSVVRFRAAASGEDLHYQWQISSNGRVWTNASTTQTLTLIATPSASGRLIRCVVTDGYGYYIISTPARLTVY